MLDPVSGWLACVGVIAVAGALLHYRAGSFEALGVMVALSFLAPVWLQFEILGLPFNIQTTAACMALAAFVVRDGRTIISPLVLLDVAVALMVIVHVLSDMGRGTPVALVGLRAYGEWGIPYVAGRYAMRSGTPSERLAWCVAAVVALLGAGGAVEACFQDNPWEAIFGSRPDDPYVRNPVRLGFDRAFGPTRHPIFFGLLGVQLMAWPLALVGWSSDLRRKSAAVLAVILGVCGVLSTISRGPILGLALMCAGASIIWIPRSRWFWGALTLGACCWIALVPGSLIRAVEKSAVEDPKPFNAEVHGEWISDYSSASSRLLALKAYWPAFCKAGLWGYGTAAVTEFPPRVPHVPKAAKSHYVLRLVDNAYLLMGLRFGWLGMASFTLIAICAVGTGCWMAWDRSVGGLAGWLATAIGSTAVILVSVWFSYDMGFAYLWSCGLLGGLASTQSELP